MELFVINPKSIVGKFHYFKEWEMKLSGKKGLESTSKNKKHIHCFV